MPDKANSSSLNLSSQLISPKLSAPARMACDVLSILAGDGNFHGDLYIYYIRPQNVLVRRRQNWLNPFKLGIRMMLADGLANRINAVFRDIYQHQKFALLNGFLEFF